MEIVKTNPRTKKLVNYTTFSADSDSSDDEFVSMPKSSLIAQVQPQATKRPTKFNKLKLGAKSAESGDGIAKLNHKPDINFTRFKIIKPPEELDFTLIPEPDLIAHTLSSQETELTSSCECLSSQELSVESSAPASTAQLNESSGSDSDIIHLSRATTQDRNKRRIKDNDSSVKKKLRIETAVEDVKVFLRESKQAKKPISLRDDNEAIQPVINSQKPSCEQNEYEIESKTYDESVRFISVEKSTEIESLKKDENAQVVGDSINQLKENVYHSEQEDFSICKDKKKDENRLSPCLVREIFSKESPPNTRTTKKSGAIKPAVVSPIASLAISSAKPAPQPLRKRKEKNALLSKANKPEFEKRRKESNCTEPLLHPGASSPLPSVPTETSTSSLSGVFNKPSVHLTSTSFVKKPATSRIPAWNPPGKANGAPSPVVSCSPVIGLRLGLSRNRRAIKPLHPDVKLK